MRVAAHHWAFRVWILSAITVLAVPTLQAQQGGPRVDAPTMAALLRSSPGTFAVANGRLTPAGASAAISMFVQTDAYRRAERVVQVPMVIAAEIAEPWSLRLQISRTGAAAPGTPAGGAAEASLSGAPGSLREVREFALKPGDYEATAVLVRRGTGRDLIATVVREALKVPDLSGGTLIASPIVLGEQADTVPRENVGRPFVFGTTSLIPASANVFRQDGWLHAAFRIYGWRGDDEAKPDVTVEYVFYQQTGARRRFFNKTKVQTLSSQSLGAAFDGKAGVVTAGTSIPLGAFPPGQFELDVRILDKRTKSTLNRKVTFFVVG